MTDLEIKEKVYSLGQMPLVSASHLFPEYGNSKILDAAIKHAEAYTKTAKLKPAIQLIEVVLAANRNYNKVVRPNIDKLNLVDDLTTFDQLISKMNTLSKAEFFNLWGHKDDKKYVVLKSILDRIEILRAKYPTAKDDFDLMSQWANAVDITKYRKDVIGEIKFVAIATLQHLRMSFGCNTVKPDQRVKEVLEREFAYPRLSDTKVIQTVERIAEICDHSTLVIDQIFVNYGSGYYNVSDNRLTIEEIARRLKRLGVTEEIIIEATQIPKNIVNRL